MLRNQLEAKIRAENEIEKERRKAEKIKEDELRRTARYCSECEKPIPRDRANYHRTKTCGEECANKRDTRLSRVRRKKRKQKQIKEKRCTYCNNIISMERLLAMNTSFCTDECKSRAAMEVRKVSNSDRVIQKPVMVGIQKWLCKGVM
jgi:RNA polymerase-binding transcription factor DksA